MTEPLFPLEQIQDPSDIPPGLVVVAIDPGQVSGWCVLTVAKRPLYVASGTLRRVTSTTLLPRVGPLRDAIGGRRVTGVLEDMPPAQFRSGKAAAGFHEARGIWKTILFHLGATRILDMNVSEWRRAAGIYDLVEMLPRKKVRGKAFPGALVKTQVHKPDWKRAAKEFAKREYGIEATADEAEACGIGFAGATKLAWGEAKGDGTTKRRKRKK